jgi:hypothetical protein
MREAVSSCNKIAAKNVSSGRFPQMGYSQQMQQYVAKIVRGGAPLFIQYQEHDG